MYPILLSCAKACRWAPPPTNNQAFAPQVPLCSAEQSRAEVAERNKRRRLLEVKAELRRGREEERRGEKQRREEEPTMVPRGRGREMQGGPLTLERYHRFFVDPWGTRLTIDHLNHIISMHGFVKLHRSNKGDIMRRLVGQVDLQPPRRSTLHRAAEGPPSDAVIAADVVSADVDAIGWTECPIGSVAVLAASPGDAPEPVEPDPRPADFVLAGRRARSKRSRSSAYGHRPPEPDDGGSSMEVEEKEDGEWLPPPPSTPPRWTRSPTPPPPPPSPPHATPPPPPPPPPREMVAPPPPPPPPYYGQPTLAPPPPPPPPYCGHPTLAPLPPRPLHFGASPAVVPWLSWGLPLPAAVPLAPPPFPGAPAFAQHPPAGQRPFWSPPTVPPCYPAPFWGAPFWGAQPPPPRPSPLPHWGHIRSPPAPALHQPPPPTLQLQQQQSPPPPPGVFWGRPAY
ncbi:hypothetical protein DAI22_03g152700 [Oryza sativa Japonica Group]|nr:formin-like protein 5 [Oryza sativa Japonica Group]KAF2938904.1 hypothetical protein DAI22_03g152700 [Oryza sativa Japonica Group]KAF2938905.1 hypothetical protein DAI22_03g152700 [Oryza sativa Japonica Group]